MPYNPFPQKNGHTFKFKKVVAVVVALLALWWLIGKFTGDNNAKNNVPAVKISAAAVLRKDVPIAIKLSGNVIAYETVTVKSRIDSLVMEVKFHNGDLVQQGQELFILDDRSLKAQIKQLEASVEKEKAQLQNTRLQYERSQNLIKNKFISQQQLDDTKAAYDAQLASANAAQANLDNTKIMLSYSTITSPITGRAGTINITQGNNVKANDTPTLVTINQVSPIRAQFAIPERYYDKVKAAIANTIPVTAIREGNKEEIKGRLEYIDNTIDPATGSFIARAIFNNDKEELWPGMFVNISLELGVEKEKLTIPAVAVQGDDGNNFVFKIVDNKAVKTPVKLENKINDTAIIESGLAEGENVITDGLLRVSDGAAVEIPQSK